jgi:DNA-binding response OmpR family regulator
MHILVVEDEQRLAALLRRVLAAERHVVDIAVDGSAGQRMAIGEAPYDLIILDRMLPEMDGLEIARAIRGRNNSVPILMLTARGSVEDRVAGLDAGADDYLVKPFAMQELLARVRALLRRGRTPEADGRLKVADLTLDLVRHEARRGNQVIELTAKEFALLEFLMRHPGQVLTRAQIVDHVWRYDLDALSNVVDIYIHYLRNKIDRGFTQQLITTVRGVGYRIEK